MAKSKGISGTSVALVAAGSVLVYSGLRGQQPLEALRSVLTGTVEPVPTGKPVTLSDGSSGSQAPATGIPSSASVGRAVQVALAQVGKPYRWGSTGPNTFDCSGLIVYAYRQAGIPLPRYWSGAFATSSSFRKISRGDVMGGDVLWKPGHVALATGSNGLVEAPRTGIPVRTGAIDGRGFRLFLRYVGASYNPGMKGPR